MLLGWLGQQHRRGGLQRDSFHEECPGRSAGLSSAYLLVMIIVITPNHLFTCNQCSKRKTVLQAKHNDLFNPLCHCIHNGSSDSMGIKRMWLQ